MQGVFYMASFNTSLSFPQEFLGLYHKFKRIVQSKDGKTNRVLMKLIVEFLKRYKDGEIEDSFFKK